MKVMIVNKTKLSNEDIGKLIDLFIDRAIIDTHYPGKVDASIIEYNRVKYYVNCRYGIRYNTFEIKEKK